LCSSVADVGETSTRVRGSSVGRVCVGGSGENTKRDGENDSEVQPEDDKRSGVGRVGVVDVESKKRLDETEVLQLRVARLKMGMGEDRLVKQVYADSRKRLEEGKQSKWCADTKAILHNMGMGEAWTKQQWTTEEHKQWNSLVWKAVNQKEEQQWKEHMMQKTKLRTYRTIKQTLTFEQYLNSKDRQARQTMTRLRGGTNELRIETGRYPITNRDRRLEVEERRCLICMSGEIEDESHFVVDCAFYDDLREKFKNVLMKEGIEFGEERKTEAGKKRLLQLLLGTGLQGANKEAAARLRQETLNFCRGAMRWRRAVVLRLILSIPSKYS